MLRGFGGNGSLDGAGVLTRTAERAWTRVLPTSDRTRRRGEGWDLRPQPPTAVHQVRGVGLHSWDRRQRRIRSACNASQRDVHASTAPHPGTASGDEGAASPCTRGVRSTYPRIERPLAGGAITVQVSRFEMLLVSSGVAVDANPAPVRRGPAYRSRPTPPSSTVTPSKSRRMAISNQGHSRSCRYHSGLSCSSS